MSSTYDGPDRHEILAMVGMYNRHHHGRERIRVVHLSDGDYAAVEKLLARRKSPVVYQINRVIIDLMKIRKNLQLKDQSNQQTTLSAYDWAEIIT